LFCSYLSNRKSQIHVSGILSSFSEILSDVPQRSVLGPLLFNAFINDLFDAAAHSSIYFLLTIPKSTEPSNLLETAIYYSLTLTLYKVGILKFTEIKHRLVTANRVSCGPKKQLSSRCLGRQTKCTLYKPRVGPILTHESESWSLKREDKNMLRITASRLLRRIYGPITENGIWRSSYNHELYKLYNEPDIVKVIKVRRSRWLGQLYKMQEQNPSRKLTLHKPEGTRRVGISTSRWPN
jgi:hypothetical protein